jgi:ABC-type transporter Mla subunit MlaD
MKKMLTVVMVVAFALSAGSALASSKVKCTVDKVDGNTVTMTCKKANKLNAGDKVTVKAAKKKAIEGC